MRQTTVASSKAKGSGFRVYRVYRLLAGFRCCKVFWWLLEGYIEFKYTKIITLTLQFRVVLFTTSSELRGLRRSEFKLFIRLIWGLGVFTKQDRNNKTASVLKPVTTNGFPQLRLFLARVLKASLPPKLCAQDRS